MWTSRPINSTNQKKARAIVRTLSGFMTNSFQYQKYYSRSRSRRLDLDLDMSKNARTLHIFDVFVRLW